jgi:putative transcriptional regulator
MSIAVSVPESFQPAGPIAMSKADTKTNKDQFGMTPADWAALDAMSDDEITAAAMSDPDSPPSTPKQLARMRRVSPARLISHKLALTLEAFSAAYDIPVATLRAWERHELEPSAVELAYLNAISRAPDVVRKPAA